MANLLDGDAVSINLGPRMGFWDVTTLEGSGFAIVYPDVGATFAQRFDDTGASLGAPTNVSGPLSRVSNPAIAGLEDGGFVVSFAVVLGPAASDAYTSAFGPDGTLRGGPIVIGTSGVTFDLPREMAPVANGAVTLIQGAGPTIAMFGVTDENAQPLAPVPSFLGNPGVNITTPSDVGRGSGDRYAMTFQQFFGNDPALQLQIREFDGGVVQTVSFPNATSGQVAGLANGFVVALSTGLLVLLDRDGVETGRVRADIVFQDLEPLEDGGFVGIARIGEQVAFQVFEADGQARTPLTEVAGFSGALGSSNVFLEPTDEGNFLVVWQGDTGASDLDLDLRLFGPDGGAPRGGPPSGDFDGDANPNQATGNGEDNVLRGRGGADTLSGAVGADTLVGDGGADVLNGDAGRDLARGGAGADRLSGGKGSDTLLGGNGADTASGGQGADRILGQKGNDVLRGDAGTDTILGGGGSDSLFGGGGADQLSGGGGADMLSSGGGADMVTGLAGNDTLSGGRGRDTLEGGAGNDRLTGGAQADTFVYDVRGGAGSGVDRIVAFQPALDRIQFQGLTADDLRLTQSSEATRLVFDEGAIVLVDRTLSLEDLTLEFL